MVLLEEVAKVWRKDYFDDLMEVNFGDNMFLDSSMISIPRSNVWIGRLYWLVEIIYNERGIRRKSWLLLFFIIYFIVYLFIYTFILKNKKKGFYKPYLKINK